MSNNYISGLLFLTENSISQELWQKVIQIQNYLQGDTSTTASEELVSNPVAVKINEYYGDLIYKYKDLSKMSAEGLTALIHESGYSDITNMLNLTRSQLLMLASYLPLIKLLKGTKAGIEIVLELFSAEYELKEWWEDSTNAQEYTFKVNLWTLLNMSVSPAIAYNFIKFCRSYVYPVLTALTIKLLYTYDNISTCAYVTLAPHLTVYAQSWRDV